MNSAIQRVEKAIQELQNGKMVILTDDENRENEGDLIMAAEKITPEAMNFIIRNSSGIVCVPIEQDTMDHLQLKYMVPMDANSSARQTPFTISIDSKYGITTGVSAYDRYKTVIDLTNKNCKASDFVAPGHVFPLCAKPGGVLERNGHTEGSIDLVKLAGMQAIAVLCEIMNPDGTMAREKDLIQFAQANNLFMLSIQDIVHYRLHNESFTEETPVIQIPTKEYGTLNAYSVREKFNKNEHIVFYKKINREQAVITRIHSSCLTGDVFHSLRCDCNEQLNYALQCIAKEGGVLIYLAQEGRGIGLFNKLKAYQLQDQGYDTYEANEQLGFTEDERNYHVAASILHKLNINNVSLLTNNPDKINSLKQFGIRNVSQRAMPYFINEQNKNYLKAKQMKNVIN